MFIWDDARLNRIHHGSLSAWAGCLLWVVGVGPCYGTDNHQISTSSGAVEIESEPHDVRTMQVAQGSLDDLFLDDDDKEEGEPKKPQSIDDLFDEQADENAESSGPASLDTLFESSAESKEETETPFPISGFFQNELAYTIPSPDHYSKFRNTLELSISGRFSNGMRWKASGRLVYDPIYDLTNFYARDVREDQRFEGTIRETYLDIPAGDWDFRLGRQHIIWGEMVGFFFADVVSAKDFREFILPDFDLLRIPQWAGRAEYFKSEVWGGEFHADLIWIPVTTFNDIGVAGQPGKSGTDFFPFPPLPPPGSGIGVVFLDDEEPPDSISNSAYGLRLSYLKSGWDGALFYYSSLDAQPVFERQIVPSAPASTFVFKPIHRRIHQFGSTIAKDFGSFVFKGEAVFTVDRLFNVTRVADSDGLTRGNQLTYVFALEYSFPEETNLTLQFTQTWLPDHDSDVIPDELESGLIFRIATKALHPKVEPEIIGIRSLNRNDWLLQAKVTWEFLPNWRVVGGADVFHGPDDGLFGQFDAKDRVYTELRYTF